MDPTTAASIVAFTVPPAATPKVVSDPTGAKAKLQRSQTRSLFQGVGKEIVLAIRPDRITFGAPGTLRAKAAFITPKTGIVVDDKKSDVSAISAGMFVEEATMDGTHADHIRVENIYYEELDQ
jgi:hypothetical protein